MEMTGFDQESWHTEAGRREDSRPQWHVLRTRLSTAYAARGALAGPQDPGHGATPPASFDGVAARRMAGYGHGLTFVNPNVSGNRNAEPDMDGVAAGTKLTGGRGQI